eukprot:tig00000269_g23682.t1
MAASARGDTIRPRPLPSAFRPARGLCAGTKDNIGDASARIKARGAKVRRRASVCSAELARVLGEPPLAEGEGEDEVQDVLTARYGVPARPVPSEHAILLLETLGAVRRGEYTPEDPPRLLSMRYVLEVVDQAWRDSDEARKRAAATAFYAANERRRLCALSRYDLHVVRVGGERLYALPATRIEAPDLKLWVPMASLSELLYGSSRATNSLRREIERRLPELASGGPHRWNVTTLSVGRERFGMLTRTLTYYAGIGAEVDGERTRSSARRWAFLSAVAVESLLKDLPGRDPNLHLDFRRQRLVLEGADPPPSPPRPPRRRLRDPGSNARVRALYPMPVEILTSLLRRYAAAGEERRQRKALGFVARGGTLFCPVSTSIARRGAERTSNSGGHWTLLVLSGAARTTRYWDSLGAPCDARLLYAAQAAFPAHAYREETAGVLWIADVGIVEATTGFPWSDELEQGSIHFFRPGGPMADQIAKDNGKFIAEKRLAYRRMLESMDHGGATLFDVDALVDPERVVLGAAGDPVPPKRARAPPAPAPAEPDESESDSGGADPEGSAEAGASPPPPPVPPADEHGEEEDEGPAGDEPAERGAPYGLREEDQSRELKAQLAAYEEFRTRLLNPDRPGAAVERSTTLANERTTLLRFLGYCALREKIDGALTLDLFSGARVDFIDLWMRFLAFLRGERRVRAGTLAGYTQAALQAHSFVHARTAGAAAGSEGPHGRPLRNLIAQLRKEKREGVKWRQRGPNWVPFEALLSARLDALEAAERAPLEYERALALREGVLLSLLVSTPSRVGIVRRLRIGHTLRRDGGAWTITLTQMRADAGQGEAVLSSKTAKTAGAISYPIPEFVQRPLTSYVERYRRLLLPPLPGGADEGWLFTSASGAPLSDSAWSVFVKRVTEKWTGVPVTAQAMRAIITTHVRDEAAANRISGDTAAAVVDGTAKLLGHSVLTATQNYDYSARARTAAAAVAYLEQLAVKHDEARLRARESAAAAEAPPRLELPPAPALPPPPPPPSGSPAPSTAGGSLGGGTEVGRDDGGGSEEHADDEPAPSTAPPSASARFRAGRGAESSSSYSEDDGEDGSGAPRAWDADYTLERELAIAEQRYCAPCDREFKNSAGARAHEHYCSRGLLRGARGRRGLGRARGRRGGASQEPVPVGVAAAGPAPPLYHLHWRSASPYPAGQVVAALATHAASPLPGVWFARLVQTIDLPSGEYESRFVVLKRFGGAWAPSQEGGPREWSFPSSLYPVEYEGRNGTVEIRTGPERVLELLGLPAPATPSSSPSSSRGGGAGRGAQPARRRGRPPKTRT